MSNELKPLHFDADYTMEEALAEAKRCLNCPKPLCRMGCPIYRLSAVAYAHEKINAKATVS